ncbi:diguanylate cyclase [Sulfurimonas sp.]|uniref:sensor domain-containing diguanylate cyclase n=1 Tax=Sulfurimonas sp. TaxID=2022749 RepID=UPI002B469A3E|nr:diguanylate cyclase [Sulfurimonas sp.]
MNIFNNIDAFIELITDLAFFKNMDGVYTHCNEAHLSFVGKTREEIIGKTAFEIYSTENANKIQKDDYEILATRKTKAYEETFINKDGTITYFYTTKQVLYNDLGDKIGLFCIERNITAEKEYQLIYEDNKLLLEYIAKHNDISQILDKIVNLAEDRNKDTKCSILLLNESKRNLFSGASPSLPDFYNEAINGVEIGEKIGSCGSAVYKKERVIVENINTHENWQGYLELTKKANLHACWSEPIFSSRDEILGSFAMYSSKVKAPSDFELKLISSYAHLVSLAIEKENQNKAIRESNKKLRLSEFESAQLFDNALVGLMYISQDRIILKANQHLANIFGYENPEEMIGISTRELHLSQSKFLEFGKTYFKTLVHRTNLNIEYQQKKKDGSTVWCELSGTALDEQTSADLAKGVLWTVKDITKNKELEQKVKERTQEIQEKNKQLEDVATKDYLTGLYNRLKIDDSIDYQIKRSKRNESIFGVIMLDIDYFKLVNDEHGHQVGDKILFEFAKVLTDVFRETDIVGRWGGEEFLIIIEDADKEDIINLANKIKETIERHDFPVVKRKTVSVGVTIYHKNENKNELIQRVDKALYKAKNSGRNQVQYL